MLESFDPSEDFFKLNPQLKAIFPSHPSKVMWALFLIYHPLSKFADESLETRIELVSKDFHPIDPSLYPTEIEKIISHSTTQPQRLLRSWKDKLDERDKLVSSLPYTLENYETLDKLLITYPKLWDGYELVLKKFSEDSSTRTKGDVRQSLIEEKKI
jgi:hypothetical protein